MDIDAYKQIGWLRAQMKIHAYRLIDGKPTSEIVESMLLISNMGKQQMMDEIKKVEIPCHTHQE